MAEVVEPEQDQTGDEDRLPEVEDRRGAEGGRSFHVAPATYRQVPASALHATDAPPHPPNGGGEQADHGEEAHCGKPNVVEPPAVQTDEPQRCERRDEEAVQ